MDNPYHKPSETEARELNFREKAAALIRHQHPNTFVGGASITLDQSIPAPEVLTMLRDRTLANPREEADLHRLIAVWLVKAHIQADMTKHIEFHVGEFSTLPRFKLLGQLHGSTWIWKPDPQSSDAWLQ